MKLNSPLSTAIFIISIHCGTTLMIPMGYCNSPIAETNQLTYVIVNEFPHDTEAFTQGLAWDSGNVYEGTGLHGQSSLRRVNLHTGKVEIQRNYDKQIFAEGITIYKDKIYQLSWKNNLIFQYDKHDMSLANSMNFPYQGWGITHNEELLIVSDGTDRLYFLDPNTIAEKHRIYVHDNQGRVDQLNELEYINGMIYANIWNSEKIAIIDPENGFVTSYLDLRGLSSQQKSEKKSGVLNGIMYDPENDRLFVTGKLWSSIFEIKIVP